MKLSLSLITVGAIALSAQAPALTCSGTRIVDRAGSTVSHEVTFERRGFDQKPGIPVTVTVKRKTSTNTARPSEWETIVNAANGRQTGFVDTPPIDVTFTGGSLHVDVGNAGITGQRRALDGTLTLTGQTPVRISCPLPRLDGEDSGTEFDSAE